MKTVRADRRSDEADEGGTVAHTPSAPVLSITTVAFALLVYGLITAVTLAYQLGQSVLF